MTEKTVRSVPWLVVIACLTLCACAESSSGPPGDPDGGTDAGPPFDECAPGEFGNVECGLCGVATRRCMSDGRWGEPGSCASEGPCTPGSDETRAAPRCGVEARTCNDECEWTEWEVTVPGEGICEPGWERVSGEACDEGLERAEVCADDCTWQGEACIDECGDTPIREPVLEMEVCVPAGLFRRGGTTYPDTDPQTTVRLSAYYIDRYPVTNARYQACVDAGTCSRPESDLVGWFDDPDLESSPVAGISYAQAHEYCVDHMDRRLPTEAEWEKAARGPYPSTRPWPWGSEWDCDLLDADLCDPSVYSNRTPIVAVDSVPDLVSPFGTELQVGGVLEWCSDFYDRDYFSSSSSLEDPTGPLGPDPLGAGHVLRGLPAYVAREGSDLTERNAVGDRAHITSGIRCARTPGE